MRIVTSMGSVTVVGDDSIVEAVADGPHTARRDGDSLVIESTDDGNEFVFGGRVRFGIDFKDRKLLVRMNPRLPLDAEVQAGLLKIRGIRAPIKADIQAGSTKIEHFTEPIDLNVQAGSVSASGSLRRGSSRIHCQAGSVKLDLDPTSSVRITAHTSLGRINLPDSPVVAGIGRGPATAQIGQGAATLDIQAEMGSVSVVVVG